MDPRSFPRSLLLILFAFFVLTGCATRPTERVVVNTKYVLITPEGKYLEPTDVPPPPPRKTYAADERPDFEVLYKESIEHGALLYKSIQSCNADKFGAAADIVKKKKSYE